MAGDQERDHEQGDPQARLPCRRNTPRKAKDSVAGSRGSRTARAASTTTARQAAATNAIRQPASAPRNVPAGMPSTEATATPEKTSEVAAVTERAGTSRAARLAAIAHTPPMPTPTSTRAPISTPKLGAAAAPRLPSASTASKPHSTTLRSARRSAAVTEGADSAATRPVTVNARPARPSLTRSAEPIGVSRPTGSISAVTTVNVLAVTAPTPSHPRSTETGCGASTC
ncbi:hypothetical protein U3653_11820 [Nocardia sp. CDC186]|uniref:Uncharacterized protein n=1 Tax=Nocardia implantans TaxID=3108168 RepID=A0ABU6ATC0_9NOCA|nr:MULTISPECIES: hypothetical protein [unclassified Nocardia]MEA3529043.1 hypothetical protein [Nocardia sp. CDC192]MEB3510708.1 hypothetical protein [Nocardia sp. CDC186]